MWRASAMAGCVLAFGFTGCVSSQTADGVIKGQYLLANDVPAANRAIGLRGQSGGQQPELTSVFTDADGQFEFTNLQPGPYFLLIDGKLEHPVEARSRSLDTGRLRILVPDAPRVP